MNDIERQLDEAAEAVRAGMERGARPDAFAAAREHLGTAPLPPHDPATGELLDESDSATEHVGIVQPRAPEPIRVNAAPTEPPPAAPAPEPEIMEPERAADGAPAPWAASTLGEVINMLERGQFSADSVGALAALGKGMSEIAEATGKRQKGTLTIKLSLTTEGDAFFVEADYTVKAPKLPRPRTLAWQDDKGRLTPSQPKQKLLFGVAGTEHGPREVRTVHDVRDIRTL